MQSVAKNEPVERLTYTIQDAARALGISERSVYNRIYDGSLAKVRVGNRILIPAAALRVLAGAA